MHSLIILFLAEPEKLPPFWDVAWSTWALAIVGVAGTIAAVWTLVTIRRQTDAIERQVQEMRNTSLQTDRLIEEATKQSIAAKKSAEALINSERAWIIVELVPHALRASDKLWYRRVGQSTVLMSTEEVLAGHHLRYKLRFTNMGRTPAQILGFTLVYTCLGEGVTELPECGSGETTLTSYRSFEHLLTGDGQGIEVEEIVDVGMYMRDDFDAIKNLKKTAVIHGSVKYRHMFSTSDDCYSDFCYVYTVSEERLTVVGPHTRQRQQKAT